MKEGEEDWQGEEEEGWEEEAEGKGECSSDDDDVTTC